MGILRGNIIADATGEQIGARVHVLGSDGGFAHPRKAVLMHAAARRFTSATTRLSSGHQRVALEKTRIHPHLLRKGVSYEREQ